MEPFRPMLAATHQGLDTLSYPVYATPKIDGIRCLTVTPEIRGIASQLSLGVSRSFKQIPNAHIQLRLSGLPPGLDGELLVGSTFNETSSAVMSQDGFPDFKYVIFDFGHEQIIRTGRQLPYLVRINLLKQMQLDDFCQVLLPVKLDDPATLLAYEIACIEGGYEGVMIRTADSPYKFGRSTLREQYLVKIKRFQDGEAEIIGSEEKMHNANPQEESALGYAERSSHRANMVPAGVLGALLVRDCRTKVEFSIGTGFDDALRKQIWDDRSLEIGKIVKYKSQGHGEVDKPRFPVFLGFRDPIDT